VKNRSKATGKRIASAKVHKQSHRKSQRDMSKGKRYRKNKEQQSIKGANRGVNKGAEEIKTMQNIKTEVVKEKPEEEVQRKKQRGTCSGEA